MNNKNTNEIIDTINSLYKLPSVIGGEHSLFEYIKKELSDFCDDISVDSIGNVYAKKLAVGGSRYGSVALICSIDEPGFVVTHAPENGKILLHCIGKAPFDRLCGRSAKAENGTEGIILCEKAEGATADDFYFETGDNAESCGLKQGDFVSLCYSSARLYGNLLPLGLSPDKALAACLIKLAKCCGSFCFDLTLVFVAQHSLASRGEYCAAQTLDCDTVISLKSVPYAQKSGIELGDGAIIATTDGIGKCSRTLTNALEKSACDIGIKYKKLAACEKNDCSFITPFMENGAKCASTAIATQHSDKGVSLCDYRDLSALSAMLCAFLIFEDEKRLSQNVGQPQKQIIKTRNKK